MNNIKQIEREKMKCLKMTKFMSFVTNSLNSLVFCWYPCLIPIAKFWILPFYYCPLIEVY